MSISKEAIEILIYLLPGFIFLGVVRMRCVTKDLPYQYYIINSLIVSLFIYVVAAAIGVADNVTKPVSAATIIFMAAMGGFLWSIVLNRDWLAKILHPGHTRVSTHDHIYPVKGAQKFSGKWHVVRLSQGTEICGVVREFDVQTHEMLIEKGRLVLPGGKLSKDSAWYYIPSGHGVAYLRTLEGENHE